MNNEASEHTLAQRKYRAKRELAGYVRLDIYIPPDVWSKLRPVLEQYGDGNHAGQSVVELLRAII